MAHFKSQAENRAKEAENHPSAFGGLNLTRIREEVTEILKLVGRGGFFEQYTLHDIAHVDALLGLVDKLIPPATARAMTPADWLLIVLSAYFHDLGMLITRHEFEARESLPAFVAFRERVFAGEKGADYEAAVARLDGEARERFLYEEFVRTHHADRVSEWIRGEFGSRYGVSDRAVAAVNDLLRDLDPVFRNDLALVCRSHHEEDLYDLSKYRVRRVYSDAPEAVANLQYAAIILRSADVLQVQRKRTPSVLFKLIDPTNPISQAEWAKQEGVRAVTPRWDTAGDVGVVEVHASFESEDAYFGLLAYLQQYAARELEKCWDWARQARRVGSTFEFPWRLLDSTQVEPLGFEGRIFGFQLDQEKILRLLTGHTLYNNPAVAVREVVQNAIDAVRFRHHLHPDEPRGSVSVAWDPERLELVITDTGTGMTQEIIERYLLNVGASYYQSEAVVQQHSTFSPISRFGIGVLSCFMIASEVRILTVHPDEPEARLLTLPSVVKNYLIKKLSKGRPEVRELGDHGTRVTLKIRRSAVLSDVESLLRYWIVVPDCEVLYSVPGSEPVRIGFSDVEAALRHYLLASGQNRGGAAELRTVDLEGMAVSYALQYDHGFDLWYLRYSADYEGADVTAGPVRELDAMPGVCVEGIRVLDYPLGFAPGAMVPLILTNLRGPTAPKTNVARSQLEQSEEIGGTFEKLYTIIAEHVRSEFRRLVDSGLGLAQAAVEADLLWSQNDVPELLASAEAFDSVMGRIEVIAVEEGDELKITSRQRLLDSDGVWTVDSPMLNHLEGLSGLLGVNHSAAEIVSRLEATPSRPFPRPRLVGRSTRPLAGMEVAVIRLDMSQRERRLDLLWKKAAGRWKLMNPDPRFDQPSRRVWMLESDEVEVSFGSSDLRVDEIFWREAVFILPQSILVEFWNTFGMIDRFGYWVREILHGRFDDDGKERLWRDLVPYDPEAAERILARLPLRRDRQYRQYWLDTRTIPKLTWKHEDDLPF